MGSNDNRIRVPSRIANWILEECLGSGYSGAFSVSARHGLAGNQRTLFVAVKDQFGAQLTRSRVRQQL